MHLKVELGKNIYDIILVTRSPDELLAVGYTKVAQVLLQLFTSELHAAFAENSKVKVAVAPVKDLQRCIAKFVDYKPPCSSHICDYLRASVLCQSFSDIEGALVTLCTKFKVTRIKSRIGPSTTGNKAILVNLVVKDETIKCNSYAWSGWWDKQPVQMLAEVIFQSHFHLFCQKLTKNSLSYL